MSKDIKDKKGKKERKEKKGNKEKCELELDISDNVDKTLKKKKKGRRKKNSTTINEKLKIIERLKNGESVPTIMNEYGIGRTTVYDIRKSEPKLREFIDGHDITSRKRMDKPRYEELDTEVYKWVLQQQYYDIPCLGSYIKLAAERFAQHLNITGFKASEGWLHRFRERHGLVSKKYRPRKRNKKLDPVVNKSDRTPKIKLHQAKTATDILLKLISSPFGAEIFKGNEYEVIKSMRTKILEKQCAQMKIEITKIKKSDIETHPIIGNLNIPQHTQSDHQPSQPHIQPQPQQPSQHQSTQPHIQPLVSSNHNSNAVPNVSQFTQPQVQNQLVPANITSGLHHGHVPFIPSTNHNEACDFNSFFFTPHHYLTQPTHHSH